MFNSIQTEFKFELKCDSSIRICIEFISKDTIYLDDNTVHPIIDIIFSVGDLPKIFLTNSIEFKQ